MSMNLKYLLILVLITISNSFLVYEKVPLEVYEPKLRNELKSIINLHGLEEAEYKEFIYKKDSLSYSLEEIKTKAVFFNPNMPKISVEQKSPLSFSFDWTANAGQSSYISPYHLIFTAELSKSSQLETEKKSSLKATLYEIQFEVEVSDFHLTKTWIQNTEDNFYYPSGTVDSTFVSFKAECIDESCPFSSEILVEIINAFLKENNNYMDEQFEKKGINAFYKSLPFGELVQKIYTQTSTDISNENNLDLCLEAAPEMDSDNNIIIFKHKGKLNDLDIQGDDMLADTSNSQKFYLNKKILQNLMKENLFSIAYEQETNPSPLYQLTIKYLKQIIDVSSYEDTDKLKLNAEMFDLKFKEGDSLSGSVGMNIYLVAQSDMKNVFSFSCVFDFKFTPTLLQNGLNFVLLSKDISVSEIDSSYTIKDKDLLQKWIVNTYLAGLSRSEYNLFKLAFDLSYYFNADKLNYLFEGNYLTFTQS